MNLHEAQLQCYEDLQKLETRISIDYLPQNFNKFESFIAFDSYLPLVKDSIAVEFKQKRYKIIQEAKRNWLNLYVDGYENKIQAYEYQYKEELYKLKSNETTLLFDSFTNYINHRTNRMKQEISYDKIPIYRRQLVRIHRRLKSKSKKIVSIFPNIIIDLIYHPFTATQLDYLSRGATYIRPNPSVFYPKKYLEKRIVKEHDDMMKKLKKYLSNHTDLPKIPTTSSLYKVYSNRLQLYLTNIYMSPIPLMDQIRALRELKIVQSIRQKLKKYKLILRETDKSGVLHIGRAIDYERKATEYRLKTGAYKELNYNPFDDVIVNVSRLLNQLKSTRKISEYSRLKMVPIRDKTELAYMYFVPKPHKVIL